MDISSLRNNYMLHSLDEDDTGDDPLLFFTQWMSQAIKAEVVEPTAMVLSTIKDSNRVSSRVVLLKSLEKGEFRFFTNYRSNKGQQIEANPAGSLLFFWKELERQVRIEGTIHRITPEESTVYFDSRPWESRVGAIVSPQSSVIKNRDFLENLFSQTSEEYYKTGKIFRPDHWGGYALKPDLVEFWQGRTSRLHDRIQFRINGNEWIKERLAP
jgi:pyridoxamine 5'-phosphate oxidase